MPTTTENAFLRNRVNMPTEKGSAELAQLPAQIRARSFFSARVAEAHILERFRQVSDAYSAGKIGRDEARAILRVFARENGKDDGTSSLKNLASTARLHLILDQNRAMAKAAGDYARMYKPANLKVFPYVRYVASVGSKNPRDTHQRYNGMIFDKRDPWLKTHWPPWDFGCKCQLENVTAEEAEEDEHGITPMSPPEAAETIDTDSGFSFNPEHALSELPMSALKSPEDRAKTHEAMVQLCRKEDLHLTMKGAEPELPQENPPQNSYREPENIEEIREVFRKVENRKETPLDEFSVSVGKILPEHLQALGMTDNNEDIRFSFQKGSTKYGVGHWEIHHDDTLNEKDAIELFRATIWNPLAHVREDLAGKKQRICVYVKDEKTGKLTNLWVVKDTSGKWHLELVDSWESDIRYIESLEKKTKK